MCGVSAASGPQCGTGSAPSSRSPEKPRRAAIESLTATEAVWHIVVFGLFTSAYLVAASWARYSVVLSLAIVTALGVAAAGGAAAVPSVSKALRTEGLRSLRAAVAHGDPERIRAAIKHAQAVGVSAEEAAETEELRAAVFGKLHSALKDGDKRRVSVAVRCARAVDFRREELRVGLGVRASQPEVTLSASAPEKAAAEAPAADSLQADYCTGGSFATLTAVQPVRSLGLSPHEVAYAERVFSNGGGREQESRDAEVVVLYPRHTCSSPADVTKPEEVGSGPAAIRRAMASNLDAQAAAAVPTQPAAVPSAKLVARPRAGAAQPAATGAAPSLQKLHAAVEACSLVRMCEAIREAKVAGVSSDEIAFAEAMLEIESSRERQAALQALRRAVRRGDPGRLLAALRRAEASGVCAEELRAAEAALDGMETNTPPPPPSVLVSSRSEKMGGSGIGGARKKVTFADQGPAQAGGLRAPLAAAPQGRRGL
uniref:Uncharacterized protein n=1 Tax=Alexandrium monilatum TaxID=311494 RepID=A0A7S4QWK6_9DINO